MRTGKKSLKSQKGIFGVQWAWTHTLNKGLHPPKQEYDWIHLSFERCEQPIDVKPGLKIRANSSVWLDFRGEKSPLTFPAWTDGGVNFTEKNPSLARGNFHPFFFHHSTVAAAHYLGAEIALHPSFPSRFKTLDIILVTFSRRTFPW